MDSILQSNETDSRRYSFRRPRARPCDTRLGRETMPACRQRVTARPSANLLDYHAEEFSLHRYTDPSTALPAWL